MVNGRFNEKVAISPTIYLFYLKTLLSAYIFPSCKAVNNHYIFKLTSELLYNVSQFLRHIFKLTSELLYNVSQFLRHIFKLTSELLYNVS